MEPQSHVNKSNMTVEILYRLEIRIEQLESEHENSRNTMNIERQVSWSFQNYGKRNKSDSKLFRVTLIIAQPLVSPRVVHVKKGSDKEKFSA